MSSRDQIKHSIFGSDSDSDSDDEGAAMSRLRQTGSSKEAQGEKSTGAPRSKGVLKEVFSSDSESEDSYAEEEHEEENDDDRAFIDQEGDDADQLREYAKQKQNFNDVRPNRRGRKKKDDIDHVMDRMKPAKRKTKLGVSSLLSQARDFLGEMNRAALRDDRLRKEGKIATHKMRMIRKVEEMLSKRLMMQHFLDAELCRTLNDWLKLDDEGSLPTYEIRVTIFRIISVYADFIEFRQLRESGLGGTINFFSQHPKEKRANKEMLQSVMEKWKRKLFQKDAGYRGQTKGGKRGREASEVSGGGEARPDPATHAAKKARRRRDIVAGSETASSKKILSGNEYARSIPEKLAFQYAHPCTSTCRHSLRCALRSRTWSRTPRGRFCSTWSRSPTASNT